jgi:plastocyanin
MHKTYRSTILLALLAGLAFTVAPAAANPRKITKPRAATIADIERLEKKIEDQQRTIDKLLKLHQLFMQALSGTLDGVAMTTPPPAQQTPPPAPVSEKAPVEKVPAMIDKKPVEKPLPRASLENGHKQVPAERRVRKEPVGTGTIVGKVGGVADAIVYIEDIVQPVKAAAAMRQEGKQFVPQVLVVTKGTTVSFPNRDAIFHNVFSPSPDNSFDLGSYKQGESRSVTMNRPGVVTVYCNMHPQMVGHVLVVPNGKYVRAGKDGFFRLTDVPVGPHRVVAWAPNAKPTVVPATVEAEQVVTIELTLKKRGTAAHVKKDGLPYGSYEK